MKKEENNEKLDGNIKENVFTRLGVTRPHTVFVLIVVVLMLGVFAFSGLKVELFPNMNLPYVVVASSPEGTWVKDLGDDELALTITDMYSSMQETALMLVQNIKSIQRTSMQDGSSAMFIEFNNGTNTDYARNDIDNALSNGFLKIDPRFPFDNDDFNRTVDLRGMIFGMMSENPSIVGFLAEINSVQLVSDLNVIGKIVEGRELTEVIAAIDGSSLEHEEKESLKTAINLVNDTLNSYESKIRSASFSSPIILAIDPTMMPVFSLTFKEDSSFDTQALISALERTTGVAQVSASLPTPNNPHGSFDLLDGESAVTITIQKSSAAVTTDTVSNVMSTLADFKSKNTEFDYTVTLDQGAFISDSIGSVLNSLIVGALLAVIIIFLFMRSWKMTLAIGIAIPLSIVGTFILMHFMGIGLNLISMSGLALAVGLLVDNSIIVLENIFRLRKNGMSVRESAIKGASQIFAAIVAATLTTVAVFIPMFFVTGLIMQVFMDLVYVLIFALLASLIVAVMFLPSILYSFKLGESAVIEIHKIKYPKKWYGWILGWINVSVSWLWKYIKVVFIAMGKFFKRVDGALTKLFKKPMAITHKAYNATLNFSIKHKVWTVLLAIGLFVASIFAMLSNGFTIMPAMDTGEFGATVSINTNYNFNDDEDMYNEVRTHALNLNGLLKSDDIFGEEVTISMSYKTSGGLLESNSGVNLSINFVLPSNRSMSTDTASQLAYDEICKYFYELGLYDENESNINHMVSRVSMNSSMVGLGTSEITVTITGETQTELDLAMDKIKETLRANPEINEAARPFEDGIASGTHVYIDKRLTASLSIVLHDGYSLSKIQSIVTTEVDNLFASDDQNIKSIFENIEKQSDGFEEQLTETMTQMIFALVIGLLLIYLVMVAILKSFKIPFIVLMTVPLAFTGGFFLLSMCGLPLSLPAMIGLLLLMGVIINNGIVMLDYVNQAREDGLKIKDAVIAGANTRARPILMTALSTIFALIPLAIGIGASGGMMAPVAIVSIGGFIYGTITSLLVIPAFYCMFVRKEKKGVINEENNSSQLENEQELISSEGLPVAAEVAEVKPEPIG